MKSDRSHNVGKSLNLFRGRVLDRNSSETTAPIPIHPFNYCTGGYHRQPKISLTEFLFPRTRPTQSVIG